MREIRCHTLYTQVALGTLTLGAPCEIPNVLLEVRAQCRSQWGLTLWHLVVGLAASVTHDCADVSLKMLRFEIAWIPRIHIILLCNTHFELT